MVMHFVMPIRCPPPDGLRPRRVVALSEHPWPSVANAFVKLLGAVYPLSRARHSRHSTAMAILRATGDIRKVSLWLGHAVIRTTEVYLRASPVEKLEILAAHTPPEIRPGAFSGAQDSLMRLLNGM